jgi:hypothetical protein
LDSVLYDTEEQEVVLDLEVRMKTRRKIRLPITIGRGGKGWYV